MERSRRKIDISSTGRLAPLSRQTRRATWSKPLAGRPKGKLHEQDHRPSRPGDPRFARQPDSPCPFGPDGGVKPRPPCRPGPRPARTRPWNSATATRSATAARACSRPSPTSTRPSPPSSSAWTRPPGRDRPPDDRPGRHAQQGQARRQRHPGRVDGGGPRGGEAPTCRSTPTWAEPAQCGCRCP